MAEPNQRVIKAISKCHATEAELETLLEDVLDGPSGKPSVDTVNNIIIGIIELNKARLANVEWEYRDTIKLSHME